MSEKYIYEDLTYQIIGSCMEVHKVLNCGFLECVYQEALAIEFENRGIPFEQEKELKIEFKGRTLKKKFFADFVCYDKIILETKATSQLISSNEAQILNYLHVTKMKLGLLVNFGEKSLKYKRFIL
jgi:GxxExxY protein